MNRKSKTTSLVNKWKSGGKAKKQRTKGDLKGGDSVDRLNGLHLIKKASQLKKEKAKKKMLRSFNKK